MEKDKTGDNEKELTSTSSPMGKLLSTNRQEKNDSNDTLPTSSTDANIFSDSKSSQSVSEDPISSTSNEMDSTKIKSVTDPPLDVVDRISTIDTDAELLGISISAESHEKIEENVYDLVNDLETLLGESTDAFTIPSRSTAAPPPKTEATEAKAECSLPKQKTEDEVSSNTDIAPTKPASSDYLVTELSLVQPETPQEPKQSQPCNADDSVANPETPMEVEAVLDSESSEITTKPVETNDEEPKLVGAVDSVKEEQPKLVVMEEEKIKEDIPAEESSCDAKKEEPILVSSVEEQKTQENALTEEFNSCDNEHLLNAENDKTTQQISAVEGLKSTSSEEPPTPVSEVSEEIIQETVIAEEPKSTPLQEEPMQETSTAEVPKTNEEVKLDEEPTKETTVEVHKSTPNKEEPGLVYEADKDQKPEIVTAEESNSKANEKEPKPVSEVDEAEMQETGIAEDPKSKATEEKSKLVSEVKEEEKQETTIAEELNPNANQEEPKLVIEVKEKEKQETTTAEELNPSANQEEPKLVSEVKEEERQETITAEELNPDANQEEPKLVSEVKEEETQETTTAEELNPNANQEEPKLVSEVKEKENQQTAEKSNSKAAEEVLKLIAADDGVEASGNAEEVPQILVLEVEDQSMEVEPDHQGTCEVVQAEPEETSDIQEPEKIQQDIEMVDVSAENVPACTATLSEEVKTDPSISMEVPEEICETKQGASQEESVKPEEGKQDEELNQSEQIEEIALQSEPPCESEVSEVKETIKTETEDSVTTSMEVPSISDKNEESPEAETITPIESEVICDIPPKETVETTEESTSKDSKAVKSVKEETVITQTTEEIEIIELVEDVPEDAEIIEAEPVVQEPDETLEQAEEIATNPEDEIEEVVEGFTVATVEEAVKAQVIKEEKSVTTEESLKSEEQEVLLCEEPALKVEKISIEVIEEEQSVTAEESLKPEEQEVILCEEPALKVEEISIEVIEEEKSGTAEEPLKTEGQEVLLCEEPALKVEEISIAEVESTEKPVVEIEEVSIEEAGCANEPNTIIEEITVKPTEEIKCTVQNISVDEVVTVGESETAQESSVEVPESAQESKMIVEEPVVVTKEAQSVVDQIEPTDESKLAAEVEVTQISKLIVSKIEVDEPTKDSELPVQEILQEKTDPINECNTAVPELELANESTSIVEDVPVGEIKSTDVLSTVIDVEKASNLDAVAESKPTQVEETVPEVVEEVVKMDETVTPNEVINLTEVSLEAPSDIPENIDKTTLIQLEESSEQSKPLPEMNIRRKTVEQDLEKVVCLSEESSDSDDAVPAISTAKPIEEEEPFELGQLLESQIEPCESQDIPEIEEILTEQPTSIEAAVESASSFETMLAVASLQNEVPSVREERRLSDKEIQEMEAIRMAVASITDSSQDTYDSFLVDSSMPLDPPEVANVPSIEGLVSEDAMQATSEDSSEKLVVEPVEVSLKKPQVEEEKVEKKKFVEEEVEGVVSPEKADLGAESSFTGIKASAKPEHNEQPESEGQVQTIAVEESTISEVAMNSVKEDVQAELSREIPKSSLGSENLPFRSEESAAVLVQQSCKSPKVVPVAVADSVEVNKVDERVKVQNEGSTPAPEVEEKLAEITSSFDKSKTETAPTLVVAKEEKSLTKADSISNTRPIQTATPVVSDTIEVINLEKTVAKENCLSVTTTEITEAKESHVTNKQTTEERPLRTRSRRGNKVSEPLSINVDEVERKEVCSPKIIIKPVKPPEEEISTSSSASETESNKGSLKMTITKQADKMHSILKVFNPDEEVQSPQAQEEPIPKLIIKQMQQIEQQPHSPKMSTRSSKGYSPTSPRCSSPRVTIKPVAKPVEAKNETLSPLKITFKPVVKPEETARKHSPKPPKDSEKNHNPKITIKLISKPAEAEKEETIATPKVTIKPLKRPAEEAELDMDQERSSPKITIKPVIKPPDHDSEQTAPSTPKLKIKPIKKHEEEESISQEVDHSSPKISIKPVVKPPEQEDEESDDVKERIVLKINRGNLPASGRESKKREYPEDDKAEKVGIKLKFSTTGGHTHIVQGVEESNKRQRKDSGYSSSVAVKKELEETSLKRPLEDRPPEKTKRLRNSMSPEKHINSDLSAQVEPAGDLLRPHPEQQDIAKIANLASQTTHIGATSVLTVGVVTPSVTPTPKRRPGRPRKVPLEIRPELITPEISPAPSVTSVVSSDAETPTATPPSGGRPKRSCRGQNVMATLGIKPRKPRGRGRGGKVNMGDRAPSVTEPVVEETASVQPKKDPVNPDNGESSKKEEETVNKTEETEENPRAETLQDPPAKKKKEDKTPVRKLEVTTRRQKAQLQREEEKTPEVPPEPSKAASCSKSAENVDGGSETDDVVFVSEKKSKLDDKHSILLKQKEFLERSAPHENEIEIITIEDDSKNPDDLDEEEESSDEESEREKKRAYVLKKKQEALRKCREKRMEKLARVAEMKKKRMQLREAKKAAEEAEKVAAEKARATKRYGRYGIPKPQISLVDPVPETSGAVKSLPNPGSVTEDENSDKDRPGLLTPVKSSGQSSESMLVDPLEETPSKLRGSIGSEDVVMVDEETRMSADLRGSRAQTPAKQPTSEVIVVEDSQGSVCTEGGKSRGSKAPKMEVFQDLESVFTADQLAEYSWNGQGPFMLQEQVTQYLAIKSFKRKYPNVTRRPVDMQERDYLKENHLVTESQCDLGLTAVLAQDILDIMYTDFQDKYEEYCRAQREKQARELADKQRALNQVSLKPGFDKLDILEQAVQSVASWNQQFNKARRDQRKAYMDLQNLAIHYPKSKMKVIPAPKVGHYPVALVPGQFIDYYKEYTPTELNNLPLNTMCYDEIKIPIFHNDSDESTSASESESESESSSSGSSCDDEHCKDCVKKGKKTNGTRETDSDDVVIIENDASSSDSVVLVSVTEAITA